MLIHNLSLYQVEFLLGVNPYDIPDVEDYEHNHWCIEEEECHASRRAFYAHLDSSWYPKSELTCAIRPQSLIDTIDADFTSELLCATGAVESIHSIWQELGASSKPAVNQKSMLEQCLEEVESAISYYCSMSIKELVSEWRFLTWQRPDCIEHIAFIEGYLRASNLSWWQKANLPLDLLDALR